MCAPLPRRRWGPLLFRDREPHRLPSGLVLFGQPLVWARVTTAQLVVLASASKASRLAYSSEVSTQS
ncbi:MAG: hypothetical protein WAT13_07815, partial [Candidatus Microthrix parvicella]